MKAHEPLRAAIDGLLHQLMTEEYGADRTAVVAGEIRRKQQKLTRITWDNARPEVFGTDGHTLRDYLYCVQHRQYSVLLRDGAFIQITYDLDGGYLAGHRLLFWPSPIRALDLNEYPVESPIDVISAMVEMFSEDPLAVSVGGPWRFDYDPDAATVEHPDTHLTVIHNECRIPGSNAIDLRRFCVLVFRHLWPMAVYSCESWVAELPTISQAHRTRDPSDGYLHMHWRT